MNIKKRALSLSLACIISLNMALPTTSKAIGLDDMTLSNVTSAGSWDSPMTGATYFSGPSVEFRFMGGNGYAPLISYSVPKIKAGCNGLSLDGGFVSLLGLDDIKDQLKDAGASLAWGVVVGLVMSLPAISQTFETVQRWVRKIQQLLQGACGAGKQIGVNLANMISKEFQTEVMDEVAQNDNFKEAKNFLNSIEDKWDKTEDFIDNALGMGENGKASVKKNISKYTLKTLNGTRDRSLGKLFSYYDLSGVKTSGETFEGTLSAILSPTASFETITKSLSVSEKESFVQDAMMFKLRAAIKGVTAVEFNSDAELLFDLAGGDLSNGADKDKAKNFMKTLMSNPTNFQEITTHTTSPIIDKSFLPIFLMNGFKDINDLDSVCKSGMCREEGFRIPNYKVKYLNIPLKADRDNTSTLSNQDTRFEAVYLIGEETSSATETTEWAGFLEGSKKGIDYILAKKKGQTLSVPNTPLVLPNINRYLSIIHKIEVRNGGSNPLTDNLKANLARANAIFATKSLLKEIEHGVGSLFTGSTKLTTGKELDDKEMYSFNQSMKDIKTMLDDEYQDNAYLNEIENLYDKIEQNMRKNAWNNLQD
jgi:hypothetical protein